MRMIHQALLALVVLLGLAATAAQAQEVCECDCYFSGDCAGGMICNYGPGSFTVEDICWFRAPKPQGSPGAGCAGDYGTWGQCDGKCTPIGGRSMMNSFESKVAVMQGLMLWSDAINAASLNGGGVPHAEWEEQVFALPFRDASMPYRLWRSTLDIMLISRGGDYMVFPEGEEPLPSNVAYAALEPGTGSMMNGRLAITALLAEIVETGTGWEYVERMDLDALDWKLMERMCAEHMSADVEDVLPCLYEQIHKVGLLYRLAGENEGAEGSGQRSAGGPTCRGCIADCVPDDVVNVNDLLEVISGWGSTAYPAGDVNMDGIVDVLDLLLVISSWGPCQEPS